MKLQEIASRDEILVLALGLYAVTVFSGCVLEVSHLIKKIRK